MGNLHPEAHQPGWKGETSRREESQLGRIILGIVWQRVKVGRFAGTRELICEDDRRTKLDFAGK